MSHSLIIYAYARIVYLTTTGLYFGTKVVLSRDKPSNDYFISTGLYRGTKVFMTLQPIKYATAQMQKMIM